MRPGCHRIPGVRDSKTLSMAQRERLAPLIRRRAVAVGVGAASVREIDQLNIYHATHLAMRRAIARVGGHEHVLVDGNRIAGFEAPGRAVHRTSSTATRKVYSIACASVVAKVVRDRMMTQLAARYPGYGWEHNQGYATRDHREAIRATRPDAVPSALVPGAPADARRRPARRSTCWATRPRRPTTHELLERELVPVMADDATLDARTRDLDLSDRGRGGHRVRRGGRPTGVQRPACGVGPGRCRRRRCVPPAMLPMTDRRTPAQRAGDAAETLVAARLLAAGWTILARNVHVGRHELDLVAIDPGPPAALVVVEVRWRSPTRLRAAGGDGRPPQARPGVRPGGVRRCWSAAGCRRCRSASTSSSSSRASGAGSRASGTTGRRSDAGGRADGARAGPVLHSAAARTASPPRPIIRAPARRDAAAAELTRGPSRPGRCRAATTAGPVPGRSRGPRRNEPNRRSLTVPSVSMRQLLEAGVHFGHQTRRWNPKMRPFIFAERNGIHIIDLAQTVQRLDVALEVVRETVARGEQVLFVGTKKQAQEPIAAEATRADMPYVNKRWLGGMLTNFVTIKKRIGLLEQLEARQQAGDFERMTKKEAAKLTEEMIKLQGTLGGMRKMKRLPGRGLHRRPASRADRGDRGEQARDPGRRHRRHERRPRRARLHHPGQRRRHPRHPAALHARRRRRHRGRPASAPPARASSPRSSRCRCPRPARRTRSPAQPTSSSRPSPAARP